MKGKKVLLLFLALLFPGCIFVFLKIFGKNEFAVEPLFQKEAPVLSAQCPKISIPYTVPDSIGKKVFQPTDTLALIHFDLDHDSVEERSALINLREYLSKEPVAMVNQDLGSPATMHVYQCVFLLQRPNDLVLIDREGKIRGQYDSHDFDEVDRLKTEITIILKHY